MKLDNKYNIYIHIIMAYRKPLVSRQLFTDGYNSFWHFVFGFISIFCVYIIPLFVIYQLIDLYDVNLFIDLGEFAIGYVFAIILFTYIIPLDIKYICNYIIHQNEFQFV